MQFLQAMKITAAPFKEAFADSVQRVGSHGGTLRIGL